jgi:hypothetical protein
MTLQQLLADVAHACLVAHHTPGDWDVRDGDGDAIMVGFPDEASAATWITAEHQLRHHLNTNGADHAQAVSVSDALSLLVDAICAQRWQHVPDPHEHLRLTLVDAGISASEAEAATAHIARAIRLDMRDIGTA